MPSPKSPSVVITCPGSVDYDALGALLALQKIYKESVILFPRAGIKNVKNFFIASMGYLLNMVKPDQVDYGKTSCLVLVGKNLGELSEEMKFLPENQILSVHCYSNNPLKNIAVGHGKILPEKIFTRPYGSITSVLTEMLRKANKKITQEEATIMTLGIYEATGVFTRPFTKANDLEQAGYLLSCGANLGTVVSLSTQDMNMGFLPLVNELIDDLVVHKINGQKVHIARGFTVIPPLDLVKAVRKVRQIETLDVLFVIVSMENIIYVAGATNIPGLDISELLSFTDIGEYINDDCVSIKKNSISQTEKELINHLEKKLGSPRDAKSLMASPAIIIEPSASCKEAAALMTRYNINTLLVVEPINKSYEGYITRQIAEKSLSHGLGSQPVDAYMNHEKSWVSPESGLAEIEQKIMDGKHRVIPVISEKGIVGVITRTDLFSYLFKYKQERKPEIKDLINLQSPRRCGVKELMNQRLNPKLLHLLKSFGKIGQEMGVEAYAVGGFGRDLMLDHPVDDLDIVVEGDAISFARYFAKRAGCRVQSHEKFNTAVIVFPDEFKVDVVSARREYYTNPAALPIVEQSSIKMDLARRDFTINTLAIHLNGESFGTMIDHFGALQDIRDKIIRIIHNLSFVEDPTRIFRAFRFAGRFGFSIDKGTQKLIRNAISIDGFKELTGIRIFSEIKQILCESNPLPVIELMGTYKLEKVIHPDLEITTELCERFKSINKVLAWYETLNLKSFDTNLSDKVAKLENPRQWPLWTLYFMAIICGCSRKMCQEIALRLMMSIREIRFMVDDRLRAEKVLDDLEKEMPLSDQQIYWKVVDFSPVLVLYMMALASNEDIKQALSLFYTSHRSIKPAICGKDLINMNIPPGPVYTKIMNKIIDARIQGDIKTREQELDFVKNFILKI